MNWPGPDIGHAALPGLDIGIAALPGPDRATVVFPPPPMPVVFISADVVADMRASATTGWIPWENADVVADMTAAVDITTSTTTVAHVLAEMSAAGVFVVDVIDLPVNADMTARVVVVPAAVIEARVQLDASAGIVGKPVAVIFADVNTSMDATASVRVQGFTTATVTSEMTAVALVRPSPSIAAAVTADMTAAGVIVSFRPSGMNKNGDMVGQTGSSAYRKMVGWTANTAAYPGSTVVSDGLIAQSTKTGATIAVALDAGSSWNNLTARLRISVNGTVVATGPDSTYTNSGGWNTPLSATATVNIVAGDVVTVEMSASPSGNYLTARSGAGTYVRIT